MGNPTATSAPLDHDVGAKSALFDGFARVGKALSSGRRVELLDVLAQGERSVEELAGETGLTSANASQHLQILGRAGLVGSRRDGNRVLYRIAVPAAVDLLDRVREVAHELSAEVRWLAEAYLGDEADAVTRPELLELLEKGDVVVLDVRPEAEYRAGHIPGARSIPVGELAGRLAEVPDDRVVVAYCRGRFCAFAGEAVRMLVPKGYRAKRLEDGLPEWELEGLPVEVGPPE